MLMLDATKSRIKLIAVCARVKHKVIHRVLSSTICSTIPSKDPSWFRDFAWHWLLCAFFFQMQVIDDAVNLMCLMQMGGVSQDSVLKSIRLTGELLIPRLL